MHMKGCDHEGSLEFVEVDQFRGVEFRKEVASPALPIDNSLACRARESLTHRSGAQANLGGEVRDDQWSADLEPSLAGELTNRAHGDAKRIAESVTVQDAAGGNRLTWTGSGQIVAEDN